MLCRLSLALVLAVPLAALAADEPKKDLPDREKLLQASPEEFIKLFDKNKDGVLDAREVEAMQKALRERAGDQPRPPVKVDADRVVATIMERLDANKDGKISKDEAQGPIAEHFARIDKNSDGYLDKDELKAVADKLAALGGTPAKPDLEKLVANILERLDANKDGKVSKEEAGKAPLAEVFDRLDRNKDGFLDKEELRPFAERIAAGGGPGPAGQPMPPRGPEFDPLDKDADGRLTRDEVKGTPLADKFDEADANKDGKIDRKEFETFMKKR